MAPMSDGPFYPPKPWREGHGPWDVDLTRVKRDGQVLKAMGEHMSLELQLVDRRGRALEGAVVEIWQCDKLTSYHHPDVRPEKGRYDEGFAGFGAGTTGANGAVRFRTIRPVPYGANSGHIHLKVHLAGFGKLTSRLWVDGDPLNPRDFNWRQIDVADRPALNFKLKRAAQDADVAWTASHRMVMPI